MSWFRTASTFITATLTVVGAIALALVVTGEARDYRARLNLPGPLVGAAGPVAPPPARQARRLVVVLIDGLRLDSSRTMASLQALRARGVDLAAASHYPTLSRPNYLSIFAGVPPQLSGARTNDYPGPAPMDTLFSRAREAGLRTRYVTDFASGAGRLFAPWLDEAASVHHWPGTFTRAVEVALADGDPLLFIHMAAVDIAGHAHGADSDEYRAAVAGADRLLARILAELDRGRDAVVVVADHGHVDAGGHGGLEPEVVAAPLVMVGPGLSPGAVVERPALVDVAPTLCALLGLPAPRSSLGRTMVEALQIDPGVAAALGEADATRSSALERAGREESARLEARAWLRRILRAVAVVIALGLLLLAMRLLDRRGVIRTGRRVLVVAVPAFPVLFYGLLGVFEPFLSPSMLPDEGDVMDMLLRYGAVAAGLNVLVLWLAVSFRAEPRERLAAATGAVLVGLLVALLPAGLAWIIVSPPYAASVPGPVMMMLPPVTFAGVACYSISAAVALIAEWAVFAARVSA